MTHADPRTLKELLAERFWKKVEIPAYGSSCWVWKAARTPPGYALFGVGGANRYAHRVAFENLRGKIPPGKEIDHECRNRACVNPWHLRTVSHRENMLCGESNAAKNSRKTHCKWGHEFSEANTLKVKLKNGQVGRKCRECGRNR